MKEKYARIDLASLPEKFSVEFKAIKDDSENFDPELAEIFEDNFNKLYSMVEKKYPSAIKTGGTITKVKADKVKKITPKKKPTEKVFVPKSRGKKKPTETKGYAKAISEATGVTDQAVLNELEDIMRNTIFHSTLDWQSKAEFNKGAKEALEIYNETHKKGKGAPASKETDHVEECRKILNDAGYSTKKKISKDGKKAIKVREPRQERSIIKDKVDDTFKTIMKDVSGSKEKDEKYKEIQESLSELQGLMTKLFNRLNNLAEDNSKDKIQKIIELLKKIVD